MFVVLSDRSRDTSRSPLTVPVRWVACKGGLCFNPSSRVARLAGAPSLHVNRPLDRKDAIFVRTTLKDFTQGLFEKGEGGLVGVQSWSERNLCVWDFGCLFVYLLLCYHYCALAVVVVVIVILCLLWERNKADYVIFGRETSGSHLFVCSLNHLFIRSLILSHCHCCKFVVVVVIVISSSLPLSSPLVGLWERYEADYIISFRKRYFRVTSDTYFFLASAILVFICASALASDAAACTFLSSTFSRKELKAGKKYHGKTTTTPSLTRRNRDAAEDFNTFKSLNIYKVLIQGVCFFNLKFPARIVAVSMVVQHYVCMLCRSS